MMLQQLHFPYPIQPTSFQTPNFVLTSQILYFLINSTTDNQKCSSQISTPSERINFINTACKIFAQHFSIQLDSRKLYCSDTKAVEELFRLCKIILQEYYGKQEPVEQPSLVLQTQSLSDACNELLTSSTQLLVQLRDSSIATTTIQLQDALAFNPNQQQIQNAVEKRIEDLQIDIQRFQNDIQVNGKEKINLQEMLSQKQADLSRLTDRLQNMKLSRPAWLGELQDIERNLTVLTQDYARKHRSLSWLEWVVSQKEHAKDRQNNEKEAQKMSLMREKKEDEENAIRENAGFTKDEIDGAGDVQIVDESMDNESIYEEEGEGEYEYSYEDYSNQDDQQQQQQQIQQQPQQQQQNNNQQQNNQQDKSEYYSGSYYYEDESEEEQETKPQPQQQQQVQQQQQQPQQQQPQQQQQQQQKPQQQQDEYSGSYYYEDYEEESEGK